jgi:DNA adenine methylase
LRRTLEQSSSRQSSGREPCFPFVKWAGGKTQLVRKLKFPASFETYFEPFLGGGAVFFYLATILHPEPFPAKLSDSNIDLMNAYKMVRDRTEELIDSLNSIQSEFRKLPKSQKSEFYYGKRNDPPSEKNRVARASWFIFLNKTGYNGLYRVNRKGIFNVPYGDYPNVKLCIPDNLRNISKLLNRKEVEISAQDYSKALSSCGKGDFIYLDPPYQPTGKTGFTDYTRESFDEAAQRKLSAVFKDLVQKGCLALLSNSNSSLIRDLYGTENNLVLDRLSAFRMINSVGTKRTGASELSIRNYS